MEKPDANGFVTINWPSRNIPHGGIFHSRTVQPSVDQEQFLKVLLEESKLTIAQRKKSALALREYEENKPQRQRPQVPQIRPRTSRRRSLSEIRESGAFEFEPVCPQKRGEDREKLKQRLANLMAYGDTPEQTPPPPARLPKPAPKLPTNKEAWHDLVTQIRERAEWLAEMEYLGQAGPHREIIKEQIAERMRALDALGVDSECSTSRSTDSGFSTIRSREKIASGGRPNGPKTGHSTASNGSKRGKPPSVCSNKSLEKSKPIGLGKKNKEENVASYSQLSPLQYSPRRRV